MIYDLNKLNKKYQDENDYEVCIIGSGAAGITIAKNPSVIGETVQSVLNKIDG